jgi:polysaccharide pyruvyl transferase WcaK-like protein
MNEICIWGASLNKVDDEAQVIAAVRLLRKRFPSTHITFFSQYGDRLAGFLERQGVCAEVIGAPHFAKVMSVMRRSSVFVVTGGVTFETPGQAMRSVMLVAAARSVGCPVVGWQLSLFPYLTWWGSLIYKTVFSSMDHISVREHVGLDSLARLGVKRPAQVFADSRFAMDPSPPDVIRPLLSREGLDADAPLIALTTRYLHPGIPVWVKETHQYSDETAARSYQAMAKVIDHLSLLAPVVLIPMHPSHEDDLATFAKLTKSAGDPMRVKIISRRYSAREIMGIIAHCNLLLASRLGSVVMAIATGTPVVAIAYENRVVETMKRMGGGDRVFDWRHLDPTAIIAAIDRIWDTSARKTECPIASELKASARASAEPLAEFLS